MRYDIRIAGAGGQGVILAGLILAEAGVFEGHHVAHTQNYGPETRGGTSNSDVVFSDEEIDYPRTLELDILLALNQRACDENLSHMKPEGILIIDADLVEKVLWGRVVKAPFSAQAKKLGDSRMANLIALGTLTPYCPLVSAASLQKAIQKRMPASTAEVSMAAFGEGLKTGQHLKNTLQFNEIEGAIEV